MTFGLLAGARQRQVAVEGVRLAVNVAGPARPPAGATPVLLLHGVPETAVAFRFLLPELAKDRRVIAPDLKGLGESEVRGPYRVDALAAELAGLILHEVDGPVDVVGHDWGGVLALALAAARPDLVRRLVLVNAPYRYVNYRRASYLLFFILPVLPEVVWRLGGRRLVRRVFDRLWRAERPLDPIVRAHYERVYTDPRRVEAMFGYYRDNVRARLATAAGRGVVRLVARRGRPSGHGRHGGRPAVRAEKHLVVWGVADPIFGMDVAESVVRDLGAETTLVGFPGVGHFPLEEAPDDVVPVIAEFLRGGGQPLPLADPAMVDDDEEDAAAAAAEPQDAAGPVHLEMPVLPQNKASGRDPDAQRASGRRRTAEVKAETRKRAAQRKAQRERKQRGDQPPPA